MDRQAKPGGDENTYPGLLGRAFFKLRYRWVDCIADHLGGVLLAFRALRPLGMDCFCATVAKEIESK